MRTLAKVRCRGQVARIADLTRRAYRSRCATCGLMQRSKPCAQCDVIRSPRPRAPWVGSRRSVLAVCRLITNSNLVGCMIGRSAGFSPLRNPAGVDANKAIRINNADAVTHQATGQIHAEVGTNPAAEEGPRQRATSRLSASSPHAVDDKKSRSARTSATGLSSWTLWPASGIVIPRAS